MTLALPAAWVLRGSSAQAVAEIDRLGDDPGMVQVLMASAARMPYGQKHYWPIYRAAVEHNLPVAIHVGADIATLVGSMCSNGRSWVCGPCQEPQHR